MSTSKRQFKIRLPQATVDAVHRLHPAYGEAGRKVQELVEDYVRKETQRRDGTECSKETN